MSLNDVHAEILYIATTEKYVQEAVHSLETVKEGMPDVKVGIYTDMVERVDGKGFDIVQEIPNPRYNFFDKVEYCTSSPFSKTLFLDTDKEMIEPCYELFDLLETGQFKTQFDYTVAQSIFSHTAPQQIHQCLKSVETILKKEGMFFARFIEGDTDYSGTEWVAGGITYTYAFMEKAGNEYSFDVKRLD